MNSKIYLYYGNFKLIQEKLFAVDDIERYLSTCTFYTLSNFQYIKHALSITLKISMNQEYQTEGDTGRFYKYARILNDDSTYPVYYYVTKCEVLSQDCIKLYLTMDTINSLLEVTSNRKLAFSEKTKVIREHQSRFWNIHDGTTYLRRVPLLSEGITPTLYKKTEKVLTTLQPGDYASGNWYLIYRTEYLEDSVPTGYSNPIKCYLLNDSKIKTASQESPSTVITNDVFLSLRQSYNSLMFSSKTPGNTGVVRFNSTNYYLADGESLIVVLINPGTTYAKYRVAILTSAGLESSGRYVELDPDDLLVTFSGAWSYGAFCTTTHTTSSGRNTYTPGETYSVYYAVETSDDKFNVGGANENYTIPFASLDRTDSRLVKIICLPYCPVNYTLDSSGVFTSSVSWQNENSMIRITDINTKFEVDLTQNVTGTGSIKNAYVTISSPAITDTRKYEDSKLYHSDYYYTKLVYDSFGYQIKLENLFGEDNSSWFGTVVLYDPTRVYLKYVVSNSISSRFLFDVNVITGVHTFTVENNDYDYMFYVSRNNEVTMFDSSYLNYIRTGYNWDVKSKNKTETFSWISTGLSVAGIIAGIATGHTEITAMSAISTASSLAGAINTTITAEQNLQAKLAQYQMQAATATNADDISLLTYYSGNKLKIEEWEQSSQMKSLMNDLFYYAGYLTNEYKVPTHNNRVWFDFLSCEPVFENYYNWPNDVINDLVEKCHAGITFLHNNSVSWDFDQVKENYETFLIN